MESFNFITLLDEIWEEESLWSHESWVVDLDHLTIGEFVLLGVLGRVGGLFLGRSWVKSNESQFLLNFSDNLLPGGDTTLSSDVVGSEKGGHVIGNGSSGNKVLSDSVWDLEAFKDWDSVGNTIA